MLLCKPLSKEETILEEKKQKIECILGRLPKGKQFELMLHECGYIDVADLIEMSEEDVIRLILDKGYHDPFFLDELKEKRSTAARHRLILKHWNDDLNDEERITGLLEIEYFIDRYDFIEFYLDSLWAHFVDEIEKETWFRVPCNTIIDLASIKDKIREFMKMQPEKAKACLEEMRVTSIEDLSYEKLENLYHVLNPILY